MIKTKGSSDGCMENHGTSGFGLDQKKTNFICITSEQQTCSGNIQVENQDLSRIRGCTVV